MTPTLAARMDQRPTTSPATRPGPRQDGQSGVEGMAAQVPPLDGAEPRRGSVAPSGASRPEPSQEPLSNGIASREERSEQELADLLGDARSLGYLDEPAPFPLAEPPVRMSARGDGAAEATDLCRRVGGDKIRIVRTRAEPVVEDRRDEHYYKTDAVAGRSAVIEALARGEVGVLERASAGDDSCRSRAYDAAVGVPLLCEMLRSDDGPEEIMIAQMAAAGFQLAGRAAARFNAEVTTPMMGCSSAARQWSQAFANLIKGSAAALAALGQLRTMRKAAERRVRVVARGVDGAFLALEDAPDDG